MEAAIQSLNQSAREKTEERARLMLNFDKFKLLAEEKVYFQPLSIEEAQSRPFHAQKRCIWATYILPLWASCVESDPVSNRFVHLVKVLNWLNILILLKSWVQIHTLCALGCKYILRILIINVTYESIFWLPLWHTIFQSKVSNLSDIEHTYFTLGEDLVYKAVHFSLKVNG